MPELTWNQRFAIIDYFNPSDEDICKVFNISQEELQSARELRSQGFFDPDSGNIEVKEYSKDFKVPIKEEAPKPIDPTAEKAIKPPTQKAKRGPKGTKIKIAYEAIPSEPTPVDEFMKKYNVSLSVLRRHSHFDHIPETGKVTVRKRTVEGREEKVLCVWRIPNSDK